MTEAAESTEQAAPAEVDEDAPIRLVIVEDDVTLRDELLKLTAPVIAFDTETTGLDPIADRLLLLQISDGMHTLVIDMTRVKDWDSIRTFLSSRDHLFLAHNAKFDFSWLAEKLGSEEIVPRLFCTMIAEAMVTAGLQVRTNLKETLDRQLHLKISKEERASFLDDYYRITAQPVFTREQLAYAAKDVEVLPALFTKQARQLQKHQMIEIAAVEFTLIKAVSRMERRGVLIDVVEWQKVVDGATLRCAELEQEMKATTGKPEFKATSPKQVSDAFRDLGYVLASTNRDTLKKITHPLAVAMLEYRKAVVLRDRYGEGWLARLGGDNRIRAQFRQIGAQTGRFSSANPNLQQLPRGDLLRKAFIAGEGRKMITADYSQIEIRILAELSKDENMIGMFKAGYDIHAATAQQMFQLDELPDGHSNYRQMAKSVNFGLIYGAGSDNLRGQLSEQGVQVSKAEAENLIKMYFQAFPRAKIWLDKQTRMAYGAIDEGIDVVTRTLGGRIRVFKVTPGLSPYERGHIARQSRNTPIQGCVQGTSLILTEDHGVVPIKDVVGYSGRVWDGERFSHGTVVASGAKRLLNVTFGGGHEVHCSPDHRFLVTSTKGVQSFVRAEDLRTSPSNMRVRLTSTPPEWHRYIAPDKAPHAFGKGSGSAGNNRKDLSLSDYTGELFDLGVFLGRIASDGSVSANQVTFIVAEHEIGILPELLRTAEKFGHVTVRRVGRTKDSRKPMTYCTISSVTLAHQLHTVKQGIPSFVYTDSDLLRGYLCGVFDGDGTVSVDGPSLRLGRGVQKHSFAKQVQAALALLGIRTSLAVNAYSFGVSIRKSDAALFADQIGFINPVKQAKAIGVKSSPTRNRFSPLYGRTLTVRSVEDTGQDVQMYDVLNSETDKFMVNGVVTHNSSADITKEAMNRLDAEFLANPQWDAHLLMTVHDELVSECKEEYANEVMESVERNMIEAAQRWMLITPVKADASIADYWSK